MFLPIFSRASCSYLVCGPAQDARVFDENCCRMRENGGYHAGFGTRRVNRRVASPGAGPGSVRCW